MTTGLVSGISAISELTNIINSSAKVSGDTGNTFSDMLKANNTKQTEVKEKNENGRGKTDIGKDNVAAKEEKNYTTKDKNIKSTEKVENTEEEITEDVMEAAGQAVMIVAEVLNVSVEDVTDALEALELSEAELLDTSNIAQIIVEITGAEDNLSLMTDENLYSKLKDISGQIEEILNGVEEENNISFEDVKNIVEKLSTEQEVTQVAEQEPEVIDVEGRGKTKQDNHSDNQMNWTESVVENIKAAATSETGESAAVYSTDMEQIYEQVSESMKLSLSQDVTEMEINLHPASLGNVKIQIAAKDGVITANFTTQNETVKAALETQIIQLKENMAEQGIKVEAIEVAVAAHAFEENLSKEGESSGSGEAETKRKRRSINLNDIDEIDDNNIVEDEIRIAREMMMHNGTTVDYMA